MRTDELMNIRSNVINKNRKDAYSNIKEYGIENFPVDYIEYLSSIGFADYLITKECTDVFYLMKYHYNRSI